MKISVWQAFASNNSGSYTIVGRFPSDALAEEVAGELVALAGEHSLWREAGENGPSPIDALVRRHALVAPQNPAESWPEPDESAPRVWRTGHQVFIHSDWTLSLPALIGQFIYVRGGRVELEIDHAHHPLTAIVEVWWHWKERRELPIAEHVHAIVDELWAPTGPLATLVRRGSIPAWRAGEYFDEPSLAVGAQFTDLPAAFHAVEQIAKAHGAQVRARLFESTTRDDGLGALRPCWPKSRVPLFDIALEDRGLAPVHLANVLVEELELNSANARRVVDSAPVTLFRLVPEARARELVAKLSRGNARIVLRESEAAESKMPKN